MNLSRAKLAPLVADLLLLSSVLVHAQGAPWWVLSIGAALAVVAHGVGMLVDTSGKPLPGTNGAPPPGG